MEIALARFTYKEIVGILKAEGYEEGTEEFGNQLRTRFRPVGKGRYVEN